MRQTRDMEQVDERDEPVAQRRADGCARNRERRVADQEIVTAQLDRRAEAHRNQRQVDAAVRLKHRIRHRDERHRRNGKAEDAHELTAEHRARGQEDAQDGAAEQEKACPRRKRQHERHAERSRERGVRLALVTGRACTRDGRQDADRKRGDERLRQVKEVDNAGVDAVGLHRLVRRHMHRRALQTARNQRDVDKVGHAHDRGRDRDGDGQAEQRLDERPGRADGRVERTDARFAARERRLHEHVSRRRDLADGDAEHGQRRDCRVVKATSHRPVGEAEADEQLARRLDDL